MFTTWRAAGKLLVLIIVAASFPAVAQVPTLVGLSGVQIEYAEPTDPSHRPIYDRLRKRQVLEQYKEFMSPLRLRRS